MLVAEDSVKIDTRVKGTVCYTRLLRRHSEALVEARQEVGKHAFGFWDGGRTGKSKLADQPVLEGSRHTLHSSLALWRPCEHQLYAKLIHSASKLRSSPHFQSGSGCLLEDRVPVGIERQRYAPAPYQSLDHLEVVAVVSS